VPEDLGRTLPVHQAGRPVGVTVEREGEQTALTTFAWTAPRTGLFVISAAGSGPRVWLEVRSAPCNQGQALAAAPGPFPHRYGLQEGQTVYVHVWGASARHGQTSAQSEYQLRISEWAPDEQGRCTDRTDDDGDGLVDCGDPDCRGACLQGGACADSDLGEALPATGSGPVELLPFFFASRCGEDARGERVHRWTAPRAGLFVFHPSAQEALISLRSGCLGPELACQARSGYSPAPERHPVLLRRMEAGESVLLIVEGTMEREFFSAQAPGSVFVHEWVPDEGADLCEDGRDNDGDGHSDGDDPGCANAEPWR
jgi:hypothetical protein